jgi:hypothetical protein
MADAPSVASTAVSFLSISLSFVATLYSSTYETERSLRELKELSAGLEKLQQCLRMLGDHEQRSRAPSKASRSAERECRTVLQCPTLLQDNSSAPTDLLSRVQEMTRHCGSIAFARSSEPTEAHCRQQTLYTPLFWRLQSWITVSRALQVMRAMLIRYSENHRGPHTIVSAQTVRDIFGKTSDPRRAVTELGRTSRRNSDLLQITTRGPV